MISLKSSGILSGNQLKIIAAIAMTLDHIGAYILTDVLFLRIIGRLAFPIFAYMIAEGCKYTRNRKKYLSIMALFALSCQLVYFFVTGSLSQCILVTFSLSVALIYVFDYAKTKRKIKGILLMLISFTAVLFLTEIMPMLLKGTDYYIDYSFCGVLLPLFVYAGEKKKEKLILAAIVLAALSIDIGGVQWYSLASLLLLALYNGKRGKMQIKNFFYIFYPAHLALIYLVKIIIEKII